MIQIAILAGFLLAALINLLPVAGVLGAGQLEKLYGVEVVGQDMAILLRHRALLFAIVGVLLGAAAFMPPLRSAAFCAGMVSMVGFIVLRTLEGGSNAALARVAAVDYVGIAALAVAGLLMVVRPA